MSGARSDAVWTAKDTTPGEVEQAIRKLVVERHAEHEGYVPARALNLVCVVDRDWSGEVANRLRNVGRYHASRTVVCAIEPDEDEALERCAQLCEHAYVVDLAWLRTTPWRERVAAYFDPPAARPLLRRISGVTVRHGPGSDVAGLLLLGWLSSRLGWTPSSLMRHGKGRAGKATARREDVKLELVPVEQEVPGLAGITIATSDGATFALDRAPGGLTATRRARDGKERAWTVVGSSRGEGGILGEGIRQALLRDRTYRPALGCARVLAR